MKFSYYELMKGIIKMERKYYLYVLLTKTPLKTGKFIRKMTNFEYNHCSISFDENLRNLYSFSRRYKNSAFYAGFAKESSLRYSTSKEETKVQIFQIPINKETHNELKRYVNDLIEHEDEYIYNYLSFITYPFRKKVNVQKAYTCCEFTVHILKDFCQITNLEDERNYCSIKDLSNHLNNYLVYEGKFNIENNSWEEDRYLEKQNIFIKIYKVINLFIELLTRYFKNLLVK